MRFGKRFISCLLALIFISSICVMPVSAEDNVFTYPEFGTKAYGRMEFMKALGFFEDGEIPGLGNGVTRAKFTNWLSIISNRKDVVLPSGVVFADVNKETPYYEDIIRAAAAGYISGNDEGKFNPNALISRQDAAAALVRLTGRDIFALAKGGYPAGYLSVANSIDIFQSVGADATAYNLLTMCYNTLNASMLVFSSASNSHTNYASGEKVMRYFHNIYEVKGVMTANAFTRLYSEKPIYSNECVEIDNVVYNCYKDYNNLLGMMVEVFYKYDKEDDTKKIVSLYADNDKNKVIEFECDALIPSDITADYILKYKDENSRTKKVKLVRGFDYIYNNRADEDRGANDLFTTDSIKLIDRDTDGYYDTVIAKKAETMLFSNVDMYKEIVYTNSAVLKKADSYSAYMSFELYDSEENTMREVFPEELEEGMVLTVYRSLDGMYIKVYAANDSASGTVEAYDGETGQIMIGGVWYKLADSITSSAFELGVDTDVLLDVYGRIAFLDGMGGKYEFKYAWLFSIREDMDAEKVIAKLITKSGEVRLNLEKNIILDGVRAADTAALILGKQLIRYKINKNGNIRVIDTASTGGGNSINNSLTESIPSQSLKIYPLSGIIAGRYKITNDTFTLVVPAYSADESNNIELYSTKLEMGEEPGNLQFACYDIDDEDASIGVCIQYDANSRLGQQESKSDMEICVVKKIQRRVWVEDEVRNLVTIYTAEGEKTYTAASSLTDRDLDKFDFGDVARYVINTKGELSTLHIECDVTRDATVHPSKNVQLTEVEDGYRNFNFGRVLKKEKDYFVMLSNENNQHFENNNLENRRIIYTAKLGNCWMVDMSEGKITKCDMSNVSEYIAGYESPSYVYARTYKYYNLNHLVVYKY